MLLTIVYALVRQVSGLAASLRAEFSHRKDMYEHGDWDTTTLLQVVRHSFKETRRPIGLFLDGLDEFSGTYREQLDLALYLAELPSLGDVKICFASRPHEILDQKFGSGLLLDMQDWNQLGVRNFLYKTFFDIGLASSQLQAAQVSHLSELMAEMAEGVFIWAKFAVNDVIQLWAKQKLEFALLLLKLAQLPREVETFWDERRERLSEVEKRAGSLLLRIACSAARPLALSELMNVFENQCPDKDIRLSLDASREAQDQVSYLSCGLLESKPDLDNMLEPLEAQQSKINTTGIASQGRKVLLAHKSVRNYLEIRGWWLAGDGTPSPEQLWLEQCTGLIGKATYAQQRSLCFQNRPHDKSNPVCKVYGCYSTYVSSGFPRELYGELHGKIERVVIDAATSRGSNMITEAYKLATRRKVTFMKKEYFSNPLNSYAFHWLAYHAWLLESRRQKLCIEQTNAIMCPELIILMSAFKHHSCSLCGNVQLTNKVRFHTADDELFGFTEKPATTYNALLFDGAIDDSQLIAQEEHYMNQLASALFVSKNAMRSNEGEQRNDETSSILALPGNSESRTEFTCLMQLECLKEHEDRRFPAPTAKYLRRAPKHRKIAVVGSRGTGMSYLHCLTHNLN